MKIKIRTPAQRKSTKNNENNKKNYQRPCIVVPYYQELGESIKRTCNKYGVQVHFKGGVTIKNLLMFLRGRTALALALHGMQAAC